MDASILKVIQNGYNRIWKSKTHGNTIEIITPVYTTNDLFVSVFITERDGKFIVTDGGWIDSGYYDVVNNEDLSYKRLFSFYQLQFDIKETTSVDNKYYYKTADTKELIINCILDVSTFISSVVSASFINFENKRDNLDYKRFGNESNTFLSSIIPKITLLHNQPVDSDHTQVKFNTIIPYFNQVTLINNVSGTTDYFFTNSIARSNMKFMWINKNIDLSSIRKRITIVNDFAEGYNEKKIVPFLDLSFQTAQTEIILWSQKEELRKLVV